MLDLSWIPSKCGCHSHATIISDACMYRKKTEKDSTKIAMNLIFTFCFHFIPIGVPFLYDEHVFYFHNQKRTRRLFLNIWKVAELLKCLSTISRGRELIRQFKMAPTDSYFLQRYELQTETPEQSIQRKVVSWLKLKPIYTQGKYPYVGCTLKRRTNPLPTNAACWWGGDFQTEIRFLRQAGEGLRKRWPSV